MQPVVNEELMDLMSSSYPTEEFRRIMDLVENNFVHDPAAEVSSRELLLGAFRRRQVCGPGPLKLVRYDGIMGWTCRLIVPDRDLVLCLNCIEYYGKA